MQRLIRTVAAAGALLSLLLTGCATLDSPWKPLYPPAAGPGLAQRGTLQGARQSPESVAERESREPGTGARVLRTAIQMIRDKVVVVGACWDYVNAVFNQAGFPATKRLTLFNTAEKGPYANLSLIKPGDWLYFLNHTFDDVGHSVIFVEWADYGKGRALTIEYVGQNRRVPGRYAEYDVSECYGVFRAAE